MHDMLALEEHGIPTVLLCTEPFMNSAYEHAAALGNADYQAAQIGHPLASLTPEQVRARADAAFAGLIAILTGQAGRALALQQEPHEPPSASTALT
jgi:hypothetical protein